MDIDMSVRNGVSLYDVLKALDDNDAKEGRRLLRQWMTDEPLPCPCCGCSPEFIEMGDNVVVACSECGMRTPAGEYAEAVRIWNTRTGGTIKVVNESWMKRPMPEAPPKWNEDKDA